MTTPQNSQREFRNALGSFATGVTIATTKDNDGNPVGVTASSFNSVSIDPPLVLWSLAKSSLSREAFCKSGHFAVHVLTASQEELSNRFACSGKDKFDEVKWSDGQLGSPIFERYGALFQCRTRHQYEGGDHIILVGEVIDYEARDETPLLFHAGSYAERRSRPRRETAESVDTEHGRFSDDFLFYLISRAHFQTSRPIREKLSDLGSSMEEYLTLAMLSMEAPLTHDEIRQRLMHTGHAPTPHLLDYMISRKLIKEVSRARSLDLAEKGRKLFVETLAYGKAFEADLANHFTAAELAEAKRVLRRIIDLSGKDVPIGWRAQDREAG